MSPGSLRESASICAASHRQAGLFPPLSLSLSLVFPWKERRKPHAVTHANTHTHTHTHTYTHTHTHINIPKHTLFLSHTHKYTHTPTHTHIHTPTVYTGNMMCVLESYSYAHLSGLEERNITEQSRAEQSRAEQNEDRQHTDCSVERLTICYP